MTWRRLDLVLVESGKATTRSQAARLIKDGQVTIDGELADKAARKLPPDATVEVTGAGMVGRGAVKLRGAFQAFGLPVAGKRCLDIGASTGGFTQQLLEAGAARVVCVDVGRDQMDARLLADRRVENYEGVNGRDLSAGEFGEPFDVVVADVSFISLTHLNRAITNMASEHADAVLLVKPQFEVGRDHIGRTGLVTDPELHASAVDSVVASFVACGWRLADTVESPVVGRDGNREFFIWLRKDS